jgi:hypothetical protein
MPISARLTQRSPRESLSEGLHGTSVRTPLAFLSRRADSAGRWLKFWDPVLGTVRIRGNYPPTEFWRLQGYLTTGWLSSGGFKDEW